MELAPALTTENNLGAFLKTIIRNYLNNLVSLEQYRIKYNIFQDLRQSFSIFLFFSMSPMLPNPEYSLQAVRKNVKNLAVWVK